MLPGLILLIVVSLFRLLPLVLGVTIDQPSWLYNFSPITALMLCGAAMFPRRMALLLPFSALLLTDIALSMHYGWPVVNAAFFAKTLAFAVIALVGWKLRGQSRLQTLLPAAVGSSVFFYVVTNTASWLYDAAYAKTAAGWVQSLTVGLPGFPPTWSFYTNTLVADVLFTLLFVACVRLGQRDPIAKPAMELSSAN